MIGKVSPGELEELVFSRTGKENGSVIMGPKYGEDTAAINIGDTVLVVNSDPIVYAANRVGTLGVNIATNDIAASGAEPRWLTTVYFLPAEDGGKLDQITEQIDSVAREVGISIIGGHSEYTPDITRPLISLTCLGTTDEYIPTSGAVPGDLIILTKGAGIEATGIIATDFEEKLKNFLDEEVIKKAENCLNDLSVLKDSRVLREYANAMHDPTEGGLIDGLLEMAKASEVDLIINKDNIIIREETKKVCSVMEVDPLKSFGSGGLLASVPEEKSQEALEELVNNGIDATVIGKVKETENPKIKINNETYEEPIRDELYDLW